MKYSNILFDLDGTLTDPKVGIIKSIQYALNKMNISDIDLDKLELCIGPPLQQTFMNTFGFSEVDAWKAVDFYREYYRKTGIYENRCYDGIIELLQSMQQQGRNLFVATSKPTLFAEQIVSYFQIKSYFRGIYGSELNGTRSDKTELIRYIINEHTLDPETIIMIGDRKHDLLGAHQNGIASIGVGYGYGSEQELLKAHPTYYFKTMEELLMFFDAKDKSDQKQVSEQ